MRALTALILASLVTPAFAMSTVSSGFLPANININYPLCDVVNVSSNPINVTSTLFGQNGSNYGSYSVTLMPGIGSQNGVIGLIADNVRCVVTVSGSSKSVRASLIITDLAGNPLAALPAC
jgi:hypothetical protein